ncbi:MAG: DUF362 domain-containing protein [Candidatus Zixiibacteriota bacterium]|nr:MAG: DUF362 domain-containing protein [candidate division Zixibacteria bacterium]
MAESSVIQVRSSLVIEDDGSIDLDILHQMIETGFNAISESNDYGDYLQSIFSSGDVIGLKVNGLAGPAMSTRAEVVNTLSNLLDEIGRPRKKHLIWDRFDRELSALGFALNTGGGGPLCFGTDHRGVGYSNSLVSRGKVGGLLSRVLVDYCDAIINIPVLKDHGIAGVTCALKNHYGSIHNPNKYHDSACDPYIADLNSLEQIRSKQRLIVVDALKVQFHGGPAYHPRWAADYGGILIGTDPVAIDAVGYKIIEDLRKTAGLETLKGTRREPIYIKTAGKYGLGAAELEKIDFVKLNV